MSTNQGNEEQFSLDESLEEQLINNKPIYTSTFLQEQQSKKSNKSNRRKTLIPHKYSIKNDEVSDKESPIIQKVSVKEHQSKSREGVTVRFSEDINVDSQLNTEESEKTSDSKNDIQPEVKDSDNCTARNENNLTVNQIHNEGNNNDDFDAFILQRFVPFSGNENIHNWLDITENMFKENCIGRNLRFLAISLLVVGDAKRKYMKHRHEIRSYDDFYAFLLDTYDRADDITGSVRNYRSNNNQTNSLTVANQTNSVNDYSQSSQNNSKSLNLSERENSLCSIKNSIGDGSDSIGKQSVDKKSLVSNNSSICEIDSTLSDLRKAIVGNFIKNPNTFKGGKDNVKKWIEEVEHLLDLAHIPESTRLDLISYSLRGDALEWFKNNRTSFTSWSIFVVELKRAFTSSFHEELAFKKLEAYSQGENQSIRSFFNDVLKLCKEADPSMSEATKLKNLLCKTKPNIQFEVRKKKPISTAEFLEYAKEAEELIQLSTMSTDTHNSQSGTEVASQQQKTSVPSAQLSSLNQPFSYPYNNYSSNYSNAFNQNNRFPQNRGSNSNRNPSSFSNNNGSTNPSRFNNNSNSSQFQRPRFFNDSANKNTRNVPITRNPSSNNTFGRQRAVNAIDVPQLSSNIEPLRETSSSVPCDRCHQFGHETSVCPNF